MLNFSRSNRKPSQTTEILKELKPGESMVMEYSGETPFSVWLASKRNRLGIKDLKFSRATEQGENLPDGFYRVYRDNLPVKKTEKAIKEV